MAVPLIDPDLSTTQMISFRFEDSIGSILKSFGFKFSSSIAFLLPSLSSQISKLFGIHNHIIIILLPAGGKQIDWNIPVRLA